ncbi:MAG: NAD(P)H-dependent oxidoreductase [Nanoarchaeota archaeon]
MVKKILVLNGNPKTQSFCKSLAEAYERGAKKSGAEVRRIDVGDLNFDPVLWEAYDKIQRLEKDLIEVQQDIKWADHIVIIYPIWWGDMPAILKGLMDRILLPGFSYKFRGPCKWDKLLKGRSAHIIEVIGGFSFVYRYWGAPARNSMKKAILGFSGIKPIRVTIISRLKFFKQKNFDRWINKVERMGKRLR